MKKEPLNVVSFITSDRYMYTDHTAFEKIMFFVYSEIVVVIIAIKIYSSANFLM